MENNINGLQQATEAEKQKKIQELEHIANNPEEMAMDRIAAARLLDKIRGTAQDGPQEG